MADLLIRTRRNLSFLEPITPKGRKWVMQKMDLTYWGSKEISIAADTLEDFIKELKEDEIEYEER